MTNKLNQDALENLNTNLIARIIRTSCIHQKSQIANQVNELISIN